MIVELKQQITFGKFQNVDLRVAEVLSAEMAGEARFPSRLLELDLGPLGRRTSVGQYALVSADDLVGARVIACVNLGTREMGPYISEALVLGTPHPGSPEGEAQAVPLWAHPLAHPGDAVF